MRKNPSMEVEVKARVIDIEKLVSVLREHGCFLSDPVKQEDSVWVAVSGSIDEYISNDAFMRIRIQADGRVTMTAKRSGSRVGGDPLVKHEHEVVINSAEEGKGIFELLDLHEAVHIVKHRRTGHIDDIEVCIDEVERLGCFIELEKIVPEDSATEAQQELYMLLRKLEIHESEYVRKGYDILMLENMNQ